MKGWCTHWSMKTCAPTLAMPRGSASFSRSGLSGELAAPREHAAETGMKRVLHAAQVEEAEGGEGGVARHVDLLAALDELLHHEVGPADVLAHEKAAPKVNGYLRGTAAAACRAVAMPSLMCVGVWVCGCGMGGVGWVGSVGGARRRARAAWGGARPPGWRRASERPGSCAQGGLLGGLLGPQARAPLRAARAVMARRARTVAPGGPARRSVGRSRAPPRGRARARRRRARSGRGARGAPRARPNGPRARACGGALRGAGGRTRSDGRPPCPNDGAPNSQAGNGARAWWVGVGRPAGRCRGRRRTFPPPPSHAPSLPCRLAAAGGPASGGGGRPPIP